MSVPSPAAAVVREPDLAVVADPDGGRVALLRLSDLGAPAVVLEGTAAAVWDAVDGVRTTDDVVAALGEAYAVDPEQIRDQVTAFVDDLRARGLVRP